MDICADHGGYNDETSAYVGTSIQGGHWKFAKTCSKPSARRVPSRVPTEAKAVGLDVTIWVDNSSGWIILSSNRKASTSRRKLFAPVTNRYNPYLIVRLVAIQAQNRRRRAGGRLRRFKHSEAVAQSDDQTLSILLPRRRCSRSS